MRLSRCGSLTFSPFTGNWYRALRLMHWRTRLSTDHTSWSPSRYRAEHPGTLPYRLLYLAENHQVAAFEVGALLGNAQSPLPDPVGSWLILSLAVRLDNVADLCNPLQQRILGTNRQELTGSWAGAESATSTQRLGAALFEVPGLEGMVVPSARPGGGRNLVIFPDKLGPRSSIVFRNELNRKVEALA